MSASLRRPRSSRAAALLGAALSLGAFPARASGGEGGGGAAALVEKEFQIAIKTVTPATVFIVPKGHPEDGSSGVIITKSGFVLSDGSAGQYGIPNSAKPGFTQLVEIRVPDLKHGTYQVYTGKVLKVVEAINSALIKVDTPPSTGFAFVTPRTADDLHVGSFTFTMGNSFGHAEGGSASLTAGIVSALVRPMPGTTAEAGAGKNLEIISSAAVNPGVSGGPLVDAEGALVGIVSQWGKLDEKNPFQLLGKAFPIDRIRAAYKGDPAASGAFPDSKIPPAKSKQSDLLETAISLAAQSARPSIVSIQFARKVPYTKIFIRKEKAKDGGERDVNLEHYAGPVSGVLVSEDGYVVTSLYNVGNVVGLASGGGPGRLEKWISEIMGVIVHIPGGPSVRAKLVAQDQQMGIALFKGELPEGMHVMPVTPAPGESVKVGRLVLCLGNPYGVTPGSDPLTTLGILSRVHGPEVDAPWKGDFQTDAAVTDANCGGAMVDIHGRILGIATLWNPAATGRSSGIGFGIPWERVAAALPSLKEGKSVVFKNGYLGVGLSELDGVVRIDSVRPSSAADKAGMKEGDVVLTADGRKVKFVQDARDGIRNHDPGEKVKFLIRRDGKDIEVEATLDKNPDV